MRLIGLGLALLLAGCGAPQSSTVAHLIWSAPTQNVDGTPISAPLTFTVYRGTSSSNLVPIATVSVQSYVDSAAPGNYVYAVSATEAGNSSALSNTMAATLGDIQTKVTGSAP